MKLIIRGTGNLEALADAHGNHAIHNKTDILDTLMTGRSSDDAIIFFCCH